MGNVAVKMPAISACSRADDNNNGLKGEVSISSVKMPATSAGGRADASNNTLKGKVSIATFIIIRARGSDFELAADSEVRLELQLLHLQLDTLIGS